MGRSNITEGARQDAAQNEGEDVNSEGESEPETETESPDATQAPEGDDLIGAEANGRRRVSARLTPENARIVTAAHLQFSEQSIGEVSVNGVINEIISQWGKNASIDPDEILNER